MAMSEEQLVNHLMFHKAIIAEDGAGERVNEYIRLIKERGEGAHVNITDPFDRSIALAFELVLEQGLDPWRIDLVQFAGLYMRRVQERPELDLITAGRLLLMAWQILRMQSDHVRQSAEPPPEPEPVDVDPWGDIDAGWAEEDPDRAYTDIVIQAPQAPIDEKIRHKGDRKVTLMELVEALEEAKREADLRTLIVEKRETEKAARQKARRGRVEGAAHQEDQDADNTEVWERILGKNGVPIPITDLQERTRDDMVKTLVSVLFLARQQKVRVWQDDFPYGMIFIQNRHVEPHADGAASGDGDGGDGAADAADGVAARQLPHSQN